MRELFQVRGMTPKIYAQLEEFVTVLPSMDLKVNVNTAPRQVLACLSKKLDKRVLEAIGTERSDSPFTSADDLIRRVADWSKAFADIAGGPDQFVDVKSKYFRIDGVGEVNNVSRGLTELVLRDDSSFRTSVRRVRWAPTTVDLSLTSPSSSDLLDT